jgi:vacuolar iron transporter family protein
MNQKELIRQPAAKTSFLKQAVIGLSDGLIITFAVSTGLAVVYRNPSVILTFAGIAGIFGALILGIGGYFAAKFRMESLAAKTIEEEEQLKNEETIKTIELFRKLDIGEDMQGMAVSEIKKDSNDWKAFLQKNQQPFEIPDKKTLPVTGVIIAFSFLAGTFISVLPYFFLPAKQAMSYSFFINLPLLWLIGFVKSSINGEPALAGGFRLLLLGAATGGAAYLIAGIFNH